MVERAELLAMASQLSKYDLEELLGSKRSPGRPKLDNKLEVMSIPLTKATILAIQKLAAERGIRPGAMGRELIMRALEEHTNGRDSTT